MPLPHIFIVAVENSSDQLGAKLISSLRRQNPDVQISAVGGAAIKAKNVQSQVDISGLSILGFSEAIRAYPLVLKRVKETVVSIMNASPDVAVLIDSWGFMIRVSQRLKAAGFKGKIVKYVAPQVWAMREGRAKLLAKSVDHVLSIHSFDAPYFEKYGLSVTHVGNPMFDTDFSQGDAAAIREDIGANSNQKICAVLFGSRHSELAQLQGSIMSALKSLKAAYPDLVFVSPVSDTLKNIITGDADLGDIHLVEEARKYDVFAASDVAIACSGTVTTQLAIVGIPTVVLYKLKGSTWWMAKKLYKPDFISLINISAGKSLMPELLQEQVTPENISAAVSGFLDNHAETARISQDLKAQANVMRGKDGSASDGAAQKILSLTLG